MEATETEEILTALATEETSNGAPPQEAAPAMPMRFQSIEMVGVGPFVQQRIEFPPCPNNGKAEVHIFTGINGCGKSTVLRALAAAFFGKSLEGRFHGTDEKSYVEYEFMPTLGKGYRTFLSQKEIVQFGSENSRDIFAKENSHVWHHFDYFRYPGDWKNPHPITLVRCFLQGVKVPQIQSVALAYSGSRSVGVIPSPNMVNQTAGFSDTPFSDILDFSASPNSTSLSRWLLNAMIRANYTLMGKREHESREKEIATILSLKHKLEKTIFDITGLNIGFFYNPDEQEVRCDLHGKELRFDVLPDGVKSIIGWVADLFMRLDRLPWIDDRPLWERSFILLLDEIEIHLHPKWQRQILPVLQGLFPNAQIFIATHSPFVVGSVRDAWVHKLDVVEGKAVLVETVPSMAGKSYILALEEIFGISSFYDVETEQQYHRFREIRQELLAKNETNIDELKELGQILIQKGIELGNMISSELLQLQRLTGRQDLLQ